MELERLITAERLIGLQETYTGSLGLAGSIIAPGGRRITPESNRRQICSLLCRSPRFQECCRRNDETAGDAAESGATIYTTECCGLTDVAIPLQVGSTRAATLLSGLVRTSPSGPEEVAAMVERYLELDPALADLDELEAALSAVPVIDAELLPAAAALLAEFADHIADLAARSLLETELENARRRARDARRRYAFLPGSLNTVADVAITENAVEVHEFVVALAALARYASRTDEAATAGEEIAHAHDYLSLRRAAIGVGLRISTTVDPSVAHVLLPHLSVRTIVDDLLWDHLAAPNDAPLCVSARREAASAVVEVVSATPSAPSVRPAASSDVAVRLARLHRAATLTLDEDETSVRIRMTVPLGLD